MAKKVVLSVFLNCSLEYFNFLENNTKCWWLTLHSRACTNWLLIIFMMSQWMFKQKGNCQSWVFQTTLELILLIDLVETGSYIMENVVSVVPWLLCLNSRKTVIPVDKVKANEHLWTRTVHGLWEWPRPGKVQRQFTEFSINLCR